MIDIHAHILPGIDDGADTLEDALDLARAAVAEGIDTIIATPHHKNGKYTNDGAFIGELVTDLNTELQRAGIPLTVLKGQEPRMYGEILEGLKSGEVITLTDTQYVFVELPFDHVPRYTSQLLYDIQLAGFTPIIVHPERNAELQEKPDTLYRFVKNGALTQVTTGSIVGKFGSKVKKFTDEIVEANLTHFIASDAHNTKTRGFFMQDAIDELKKRHKSQYVDQFLQNAERLVRNERAIVESPKTIKRKKFLGIF
ncbi:tyrosine protein phosphatase [Paenalkalicoccus suaedae]|uniref:Tyrosine-protein phosphatase n=1 Tax=Paenalkalicoccus suaedae TaxID=2592382 RepID=A0A859FIS0_9BACI|nr:CpsB/CapC family capsule biosynthesis tyrosine phosphatase [Paenalkalicoccus suaedae]QKS72612.1 tyrosine protein phosphatase [Paenalkalicoccus suaedae]